MDAVAAFDAACSAAMAEVHANPAGSLPVLDALLADAPRARHADLESIAETGEPGVTARARHAAEWRCRTLNLLECRRAAAVLLADADQIARTRALAAEALAGAPDDPYWATLWEQDAEAATDPDEAARLLDAAFARRVGADEALAAARNRMRAASLAAGAGRLSRARQCADQALESRARTTCGASRSSSASSCSVRCWSPTRPEWRGRS